jgi:hypothetical protein
MESTWWNALGSENFRNLFKECHARRLEENFFWGTVGGRLRTECRMWKLERLCKVLRDYNYIAVLYSLRELLQKFGVLSSERNY